LVATCLLDSMAASQEGQAAAARRAVDAEVSELLGLAGAMSELIVVSSEVGLGVVPVSASGRLFRDLLGSAHQRVAEAADRVYLLFAGLPLTLKPAAPLPSG
jgi:adenosyl cobinamide kinase/adenosyl cobinamide phosphate guanylyltransferase